MAIKAEISTKTPCEVVFKVTVGREELTAAYEKALVKNSKLIELPGFRKGKAPRTMVEEKFRSYFESEAVEDVINKVISSLVKQYRLDPATQLKLEDETKFPTDGDLTFTAELEVAPKVENVNYTGLKLKGHKHEVTDDEVEREIAQAAERFATYEDVKDNRPARFGDWAIVSYKATFEGKEVFKRDSAWAEVAQDRKTPVPGFCAELSGLKNGEEKTFTLNSGAEFFMKEYVNKDLDFTVKMETVKERVVPKVDDELAKKINPEVQTLEEFRGKVKEAFVAHKSEIEQNRLCELARELLVKDNPLPLPPAYIVSATNSIIKNELEPKLRRGELKEEAIQDEITKIRPACEEKAKSFLTSDFILAYIAQKEKIVLAVEDVMPRLQEYAQMFGRSVPQVYRMFEQTGKLEEINTQILQEKTLKFVVSKAEVTYE